MHISTSFRTRVRLLAGLAVLVLVAATPAAADNRAAAPPVQTAGQAGSGAGSSSGSGVQLLSADDSGVSLAVLVGVDIVTPLAQEGGCLKLELPGYVSLEEAGQPSVPVKIVTLGVPPGVELLLDVQPGVASELIGTSPLCITPPDSQQGDVGVAAGSEAARQGFYPSQMARLVDLGYARSQRLVRLEIMPVQVDRSNGKVLVHDQVRVALRFQGQMAATDVVSEPSSFETVMREMLLNYDTARTWRAAAPPLPSDAHSWTPPQPGYKMLVKETGMYFLTRAMLAGAGLPVDSLDPRTLRVYNAGQELAILVNGEGDGHFDEGDGVLIYGQGINNRYTDTDVYWLTYGGAAGRRMGSTTSLGAGAAVPSYPATLHQETNLFYVSSLPEEPGFDHWYGPRITASGGAPGRRDFIFSTSLLAAGSHVARVRALLAGNTTGVHHLRLYVNDQQIADTSWSFRTVKLAEADFPQSYLTEGNSTIRVELVNDTPAQVTDQVYVDWVGVTYQRQPVAINSSLRFAGEGTGPQQYEIKGFATSQVEVYDVTDAANVTRISGAAITPDGGSQTLRFVVNQGQPRTYFALNNDRRLAPSAIVPDAASDLQNSANGADYLIVSHGDFIPALQPLANLRAAQGMRVKVVDVQDVYDEFNFGTMSAESIRDFLAFAFAQWQEPRLGYVLLVGDGTYDFRHYLPSSAFTYLPPYLALVDPEIGETATDNRFAAISGSDILPDVNVGRLPANTAAQTTAMVNKILDYEGVSHEEAWTQRVLFVSDNLVGGGGNFYALSDAIADGPADPPNQDKKLLPETYQRPKIYMGVTCPSQDPSVTCRSQLLGDLSNTGALMVSYIGHGTKTFWAEERLLDIAGLTSLQNAGRLPIMLPMTCDEGYFIVPETGAQSTSEAGIRLPERGAIASYAPTGFGLSSGHDYLERGLFQALFHDHISVLGAATTASKYYLIDNAPPGKYLDLIDTFLLMGDPALHVPLPPAGSTDLFLPLLHRSH